MVATILLLLTSQLLIAGNIEGLEGTPSFIESFGDLPPGLLQFFGFLFAFISVIGSAGVLFYSFKREWASSGKMLVVSVVGVIACIFCFKTSRLSEFKNSVKYDVEIFS